MLMKQGEKIQVREMVEDVLRQIEQIEGWQQQVMLVNKKSTDAMSKKHGVRRT